MDKTNTPIVRFGVIGTGWITAAFIKATKKVAGLQLCAVYSRTEEKAAAFAKENGCDKIFTDLEEMAAWEGLDGVYIASPNKLHYQQSKLFLSRQKHVICEKPVTVSGSLAADLLETAEKNGVIFMEAIMSLHTPQLAALENAMKQIGRISQAKFDYCQLSSKYPALQKGELPNIFNPDMKTGSAMDIGIYCAYLALYLFGQYESLLAYAVKHENGIDLNGSSILCYPDSTVTLTYSKIGDGRTKSELIGDKGTITLDKLSSLDGITLHQTNGETVLIHQNGADILPMQFEAQAFYDYITDFPTHKEKYERLSRLCILVSDTLQAIRKECGMTF